MNKYLLYAAFSLLCVRPLQAALGPVDYVNPLMGSLSSLELSNGNTYPTVCVPFGMHNWAPHTGKMGDGFLYTYQTNYLYGFKQTHQASLWINDYSQFSMMPIANRDRFTEQRRRSWYSHKKEVAKPHYYSVYLADHHARFEMTATERAAAFRVKYHPSDSSFMVIDAYKCGAYVRVIPEKNMVVGYNSNYTAGVSRGFKNYFVMVFDRPFTEHFVWYNDSTVSRESEMQADRVGAVLGFGRLHGVPLTYRVASSYISFEQALLNLQETEGLNFDELTNRSRDIWNRELGKITVEGGTHEQLSTFYTCFYRMLIFPRKFYERNAVGDIIHYSPYTGQVLPGYLYADNGFWDTFRSQFPFMNLLYPDIVSEVLQSLENIYRESGWLPEWFSPGHRDCMIGSHSASIIADAYLKGIRGYNIDLLYEAIIKNTVQAGPLSSIGRLGAQEYNDLGYIPCDAGINQNVSRTLEYAYDDYCIYLLGKALNRPKHEVDVFRRRSKNYRHLFDSSVGLMRPRCRNGKFLKDFNPFKWGEHFTEGNSWQYTWFVPHDIEGLKNLYGSEARFLEKMDSVFSLPPIFDMSYYKRGIIHLAREMQGVDMGQYAHLNEPMHHMVYMYAPFLPWKTQHYVRHIMNTLYLPVPDGYCGDEDNGQMSSWYVFSAMGFYPVCPIDNRYVLGSPLFPAVSMALPNGKVVRITARGNTAGTPYVSKVELNGRVHDDYRISYEELIQGAELNFTMSPVPVTGAK